MTFKNYIEDYLYTHGMAGDDLNKVKNSILTAEENKPMADRWDDQIENYPDSIRAILNVSIKSYALDYIKKECPLAWFRPMFED